MNRRLLKWKVSDLLDRYLQIDFPEYQREPNIWSKLKRSRLIDSMRRKFDISTLYLYKRTGKTPSEITYECVDGRQRIRTLLTLYGRSIQSDDELHFQYRPENEVSTEDQLDGIAGFTTDAAEKSNEYNSLIAMRELLLDYEINVVELDSVADDFEMALLFLRLNLGQPLNAGEKLHAMIGDARDAVFGRLSTNSFFTDLSIPKRRFARELVAAQVLMQVFSVIDQGDVTRTRHSDLEIFLKQFDSFSPQYSKRVDELETNLKRLATSAKKMALRIDNRAIAVTYALYHLIEKSKSPTSDIVAEVLEVMRKTIRWQAHKNGASWHSAYRRLADFQLNVTQAAVEPYAVKNRHKILKEYVDVFERTHQLLGDAEYKKQSNKNPARERQSY